MPSAPGVEQLFLFHCSCGATIQMCEKTETCSNCGRTIEVIGCVPTRKGDKYTLRITKPANDRSTEPLRWRRSAAHRAWHHRETPDYNQRFTRLGLRILLLGVFMLLSFRIGQEGLAILTTPKPNDCNWYTAPAGDKHCHYESIVFHTKDQNGENISVRWHRVNDY